MSYSTSNPPRAMAQVGGGGARLWYYASTDVHTDVDASGYFTNGADLGLAANDVMIVVKTDATIGATIHVVTSATTIAPAILA